MAWIEFHASRIKRLKKFADFRKALNWSTIEGLGFLGSFWGEVIELAEDGNITGWTPEYIAELTGLKTDPGRVWEALARNGWIDERGGKVMIHDWIDTAGTYLRSKYATGKRQKLVEIWAIHGLDYGNPMGTQLESNRTIPNQTLPTKPTILKSDKPKFSPPSAQEATEYAKSIGFRLDGEEFVAHYAARGWKYGPGRPMVSWQAAVVTWKKKADPSKIIQQPRPIQKPAAKVPPPPDLTPKQIEEMHREFTNKLGPCKDRDCGICYPKKDEETK